MTITLAAGRWIEYRGEWYYLLEDGSMAVNMEPPEEMEGLKDD